MTVDKIVKYLNEDIRRWDETTEEIWEGGWEKHLTAEQQLTVLSKVTTKREYVRGLLSFIKTNKD